MDFVIFAAIGVLWFACGYWAYRIEKAEFPNPVVPGADELFSAVLLFSGPAGLLAALFMSRPPRKE